MARAGRRFTLALWSRGGSLSGPIQQGSVLVLDSSASNGPFVQLDTNFLVLGATEFSSPSPLEWHQGAWAVHGNGTAAHYLDGELLFVKELVAPFSLRRPDTTMYLGGRLMTAAPFGAPLAADLVLTLRGELDELMLYSRPLDADAVRALYLRPARGAAAAGAVLHYSFDVGGCALAARCSRRAAR